MKTIVQIDGKRADGAGVPPHATIYDADFVPRLGEVVTVANWAEEQEVTKVAFHYATDPKDNHRVTITVKPYVERPPSHHV